jgi:hypothetical protein
VEDKKKPKRKADAMRYVIGFDPHVLCDHYEYITGTGTVQQHPKGNNQASAARLIQIKRARER